MLAQLECEILVLWLMAQPSHPTGQILKSFQLASSAVRAPIFSSFQPVFRIFWQISRDTSRSLQGWYHRLCPERTNQEWGSQL